MKRAVDIVVSAAGLVLTSPLIGISALLVWLQDLRSPVYVSLRVRNQRATFRMYKFRSMVPNADRIGGTSTAADDRRLTTIGRVMRVFKIDELPQLWNVLIGDMSLVGPRPQVVQDAIKYTTEENHLFDVRPGITDFSSIVFADEGDILEGAEDPDQRYDEVIRPWKSRLGLFYARNHSVAIDTQVVLLTILAILSRRTALRQIQRILRSLGAEAELVEVAGRTAALAPAPPPGAEFPAENGPYIPESVFERSGWLQTLNRIRRVPVVAVQVALIGLSNYFAWLLRYDGVLTPDRLNVMLPALSWLIGIRALTFLPLKLYQGLWLYTSLYDLIAIVRGVLVSSVAFWVWVRFFLPPATYPQSVMLIDALMLIMLLGGIRMSRRLLAEVTPSAAQGRRVLIYGAGRGGEMMVRQMRTRRPAVFRPVGLIDDNFRKLGLRIHGVPVVGNRRDLPRLISKLQPDELVIAAQGLSAQDITAVKSLVEPWGLQVSMASAIGASDAAAAAEAASIPAAPIPAPRIKARPHKSQSRKRRLVQLCPRCQATSLNRSKARNIRERIRRRFSERRLFRCPECDWRGWLVPMTSAGPVAFVEESSMRPFDLTMLDQQLREATEPHADSVKPLE